MTILLPRVILPVVAGAAALLTFAGCGGETFEGSGNGAMGGTSGAGAQGGSAGTRTGGNSGSAGTIAPYPAGAVAMCNANHHCTVAWQL